MLFGQFILLRSALGSCSTNSCSDRANGAGVTNCVNRKTDAECSSYYWDSCSSNYAAMGMGCAKHCIENYPQLKSTCSNGSCSDWSWPDCDGSEPPSTTTRAPDGQPVTLPNGVIMTAICVAKPGLAESAMAGSAAHCTKYETNKQKCIQYQQFCDWQLNFEGMDDTDDKRMTEDQLFGEAPDVLWPLYSANFGIFPPKEAEGWWFSTNTDGTIAQPKKSKWVFWHHDVETNPPFEHLGCDCYEDTYRSEDVRKEEDGYYLYNTECSVVCSKNMSGTDRKNYSLTTVHDRVCHREFDIDGVAWDPSPNMNYWNPLNKLFPDSLGKDGLNMQRGENGSSWYWWGHSKPSWDKNDQTSNVHVGELRFDSEIECRNYAQNYWLSEGYNIEFKSICSQFSSKRPCADADGEVEISNNTCRAACDGGDSSFNEYFKSLGLIDDSGSITNKMISWFHENCEYTPYQPMNDHVWPNFYVPDNNSCFSQWQIGYEDQGCDTCLHPQYDNTPDFDNGWSYGPVEGSSIAVDKYGKGSCAAQCGKIIMDGPGKPRDVKTAQECQQYCQEDPQCMAFQWRPVADWNLAPDLAPIGWGGNHINQVRSCLLKNKAQYEGALAARWDETGRWVYDAKEDYASYANIYQNTDCWPNLSGANWCLRCEESIGGGKKQTLYHSFKWRNNMISGPKYCDVPKLVHGSTDRVPSRFWDNVNNPQKVPKCPSYPGIGTLKGKSPTKIRHNADGTLADQTCEAKADIGDLEGGNEWAQHCESAARIKNEESCDKFQQYCDWHIYYRKSGKTYKAISEDDLFGPKKSVNVNTYSSGFNIHPPTARSDGSYSNDLPARKEKWVFWHYDALSSQSTLSCDCLAPSCNDPHCEEMANNANTVMMYTLPDKVCHLESQVNGVLFDPNPTLENGVWEKQWTSGLGMGPGESGSSWFWYGVSKPSWNEFDQTSFTKEGEILFDTEDECREHAVQYWADMGFTEFMSVCEMFASKTIGVSNIDCIYACDGRNNKDKAWFQANCVYTDYHATSDNVWPNFVVSDSNTCYAQWQIGYEDQACDECLDDEYDNSSTYDNGWKYTAQPKERVDCNAKCGKVITDAPGVFRDVKTAQECQAFCQADRRCVAFQWRATPDWAAANGEGGNRINRVRACILKDIAMVEGALKARWNSAAEWVGGSDPDWHEGMPDDVVYNEYSQGFWAMKDSQFGSEAKGWYLMCTFDGDSAPTAHSWKWRNTFISGPKYCDPAHSLRISHGKVRESSRTYTPDSDNGPKACPTPAQYTYTDSDVASMPRRVEPAKCPDFEGSPAYSGTTTTTSTITPPEEVSGCCDIQANCSDAWDYACQSGSPTVLGCAKSCSENVWDANHGNCKYYMDKFCAEGDRYCASHCAGEIAPTTTTSTTTPCPNEWSGAVAGCQYTTTSTTTTTTTTTEWVPYSGNGDHDALPTDAAAPWSLPNVNGSVYLPTYIKERDGISSAPGPNVNITTKINPPSYCAEGTPGVEAGSYSQDNYFKAMGFMKLKCAGYSEEAHSSQIMVDMNCEDGHFEKYSWEHLAMAAGAFPDFLTTHGKEKQAQGKERMVIQTALAGFLANAFTETRGGTAPGQGFCFLTEQQPLSYGCDERVGNNDYIGRGAFQLTWCTNYRAASEMLAKVGVVTDFYNNPETVLDRWFPFGTAVAFWMSPQTDNGKPSMDYVSSYWVLDSFRDLPIDNASRVADFGYAVNIINGGIECAGRPHPAPQVRGRMAAYFLDLMGYQGTKDTITLYGCQTPIAGANTFQFFYLSDGTYDPADTTYGK